MRINAWWTAIRRRSPARDRGHCVNAGHDQDTSHSHAKSTPPCGLKHQRSSGDGTFKLRATITWQVSWTGTGGAGGDLPNGAFGTTQDITVQEIQAVNR
jgi:hypothetical protein